MSETIRIANDKLSVAVSPRGAETQSIMTSDGRSWLWNGDAEFWTGRAPILFPIVGKAPDDTITIDGQPYTMKQHGFARKFGFRLAEHSDTVCRLELEADARTKEIYPFDFRLSVAHVLEGATLKVVSTVVNSGDKPMPFGFGYHPAFNWPMPGMNKGHVHHVHLENDAEPFMVRLRDGLIDLTPLPSPFSKGLLALDHDYFVDDAMIFPEGAGDRLTLSAEDGPALHFTFENLPNLALWTKPGAPYICVEPWHGMAAAHGLGTELSARPSTKTLAPGESTDFTFTVTFDG
ncbi:aldose 1-epimerase family protein [Martelella mediterranea]|uniref:Galactose mutarotase-like enzyme n=1 Tax=Martelella mediterranea TaxID=293089 RepID=A0A4R3NVK7_9HYPH|nr:aldose 1-epimerase family protein [Martelella mediterranea]TCT42166.1 galactose mutarotase-like enzyme [Martelella mediterranea]